MNNLDVGFLVVLVSQLAILVTPKPSSNRSYILPVGLFVAIGLCALLFCFSATPNENIVLQFLGGKRVGSRSDMATLVFCVTCGLALGWLIGLVVRDGRWARIVVAAVFYLFLCGSVCLVASKAILSKYLANPAASSSAGGGLFSKDSASGWSVRKLADLTVNPTAMAVMDNGDIVVVGYSGGYLQRGVVIKLSIGSEGVQQREVASGMTRPHGIAVRDNKIYVSRAGQYSKAIGGRLVQMNTGGVTELQDLDGDGIYEYADDIVDGLPGAQLPDGLHQNNNITFTRDGALLVTVGTPTDHAPPTGSVDGTILEVDVHRKEYSVYAMGFRNPFGLAISEGGRVFCTDNDSNDKELGDRLIEIQKGADYGHPYADVQGVEVQGVDGIFARVSSAQGIAFYPEVGDPALRGKLLIASYGDDSIGFIDVETPSSEIPERGVVSFLAKVPSPVAVCCRADGVIYACSYQAKALYEIRYNP